MERGQSQSHFLLALLIVALASLLDTATVVDGAIALPKENLIRQFYKKKGTCKSAEPFVKHQVKYYMSRDKTIAPKLARLLFSDCFVSGCDGSILLEGPDSERTAPQNAGLGAFVLIDKIKQVLEHYCPGVVSCADILNLATRDAIHRAGGPSYIIRTGRRDGFTSKASMVNIPSPNMSWQDALAYFKSKGLDVLDMTTLLGVHSLGKARCRHIVDRLYNYSGTGKPDPSMDPTLLAMLQKQCPQKHKKGEHEGLVFMDPCSNYMLSSTFYQRILAHKAVLGIDQQQVFGNDTLQITQLYANTSINGFEDFRKSLALSMARMGEIDVLTGSEGEIRKDCRFTNANNPYLK